MRFFGILKMWRGWQKAFVQIAQRGIWSGWKPRKYWGSLTVCEGVSLIWLSCLKEMSFPHCMWGCIVLFQGFCPEHRVPSLHVRVYRWQTFRAWRNRSSLTVCEGVSTAAAQVERMSQFPHCTWGCIADDFAILNKRLVPSLYVRVYRHLTPQKFREFCSLTVCEGVS